MFVDFFFLLYLLPENNFFAKEKPLTKNNQI